MSNESARGNQEFTEEETIIFYSQSKEMLARSLKLREQQAQQWKDSYDQERNRAAALAEQVKMLRQSLDIINRLATKHYCAD